MVAHSQIFEAFMGVIILFNVVQIMWQADYDAQCFPKYVGNEDNCPFKSDSLLWVRISSIALLAIYTLEGAFRVFVDRTSYFQSKLNLLDVLVIVVGWIGVAAEGTLNLAFLRVIRLSRLTRAFRILLQVRELYLLLNGVLSSIRAILLGTCLLFALLAAFSIILVEYVHPVNSQIVYPECDECDGGFKSVWYSVLTLFKQLIAGDSWIISFPLLDKSPALAPLLIFVVVTVTLGVLNLILTVIVERAAEARERDLAETARLKSAEFQETKKDLIKLCHAVDTSGDGKVTLDELVDAYRNLPEFRDFMTTLDVQEHDLSFMLNLLDVDNSGYLDCQEFSDELIKLKSNDTSMLLALNRYQLAQLGRRVEKNVETVLSRVMKTTERHESQLELISGKLDRFLFEPSLSSSTQPPCLDAGPSEVKMNMPGDPSEIQMNTLEKNAHCQESASSARFVQNLDKLDCEIQNLVALGEQLTERAAQQVSTLTEHAAYVHTIKRLLCHSANKNSDVHVGEIVPFVDQEEFDAQHIMLQIMHGVTMPKSVLLHDVQLAIQAADAMLSRNTVLFGKLTELMCNSQATCSI